MEGQLSFKKPIPGWSLEAMPPSPLIITHLHVPFLLFIFLVY